MKFVSKIIRPLLSIIGILLIGMLVACWIAMVIALFLGIPFAGFIAPGSSLTTFLGSFNILFVVGIPLLMVVLFIMRVFLKSNFRPKWQFGLWAFWIINVISLSMIAMMTAKDFQYGNELGISEDSYDMTSDTLFVEMERSPFRDSWFHLGDEILISDEQLMARSIRVIFEKSPSGRLEVVQKNEARGGSLSESQRLSEAIGYSYRLEGNRLILPSHFTISKGDKWRAQRVLLHILVPEGMYVERNSDVARCISGVEEDRNYKFPWYRYNKHIWQMGPNGMIAPDYISDYKKEFNLHNFSKIRLEGDIKLKLKQGSRYEIVLNESDSQNEVEITKTDDRLNIYASDRYSETYELDITMPRLEELWVIQSDDIEIKDFELSDLRIVNEGNGNISVFAEVKNLDLHLTGSNEFDIRGEGDYLNAILTDDAQLDAEHFTVKKANLELDNGSLAKISATDTLWQKVIDSEIVSRGGPIVIEEN